MLPTPNGTPPWNTTLPVIQLDAADPGGLASLICFEDSTLLSFKLFAPATTIHSEQLHPSIDGIQQISCTVTDTAGNQTTFNDFIHIDTTAPLVTPTVSPNPVVLNGTATATANATDAMSGVASQSCGPVSTGAVGTFTVIAPRPMSPGTRAPRRLRTTSCLRRASASANRAERSCSR